MNSTLILLLVLLGCTPRYSVYERPMFGGETRSETQRKNDSLFVIGEIDKYGSMKYASSHNSKIGWQYLYSTSIGWSIPFYRTLRNPSKTKTAMQYFNKAWLIDSLNGDAYWGMSIIVATRDKDYENAEQLMEKAVKRDSTNIRVWFDYGVSNWDVLEKAKNLDETKITRYRNKGIKAFQRVIESSGQKTLKEKAEKYLRKIKSD